MRMGRKNKLIAGVLCASLLLSLLSGCGEVIEEPQSAQMEEAGPPDYSGITPEEDFYGYVNAAYLSGIRLDPNMMMGGVSVDVMNTVSDELDEIIDEIVSSGKDYAPGTNEQLIRDYYNQCHEYVIGEHKDSRTIVMKDLGKVEQCKSVEELLRVTAELSRKYQTDPFFGLGISADPYVGDAYCIFLPHRNGLCGGSYKSMYESKNSCTYVENFIRSSLTEMGATLDSATERSKSAIRLLLDLIRNSDYSVEEEGDVYKTLTFLSNEELAQIFTNVDLEKVYAGYGIEKNPYEGAYIQDRAQLEELNRILLEENLRELKDLEISAIINSVLDFVSWKNDVLSSYTTANYQSAEKRSHDFVKYVMEREVGELYAQRYYTEGSARKLEAMCEQIREGYRTLIGDADWLTEGTRQELLKKLDRIRFVLGGGEPHPVDAGDAELIGENAFDTYLNMLMRSSEEQFSKAGQKRDPSESGMSPQTVNACYAPNNTVTITVAIMTPPYFDEHADDMTNLGALGFIVAHEVGHAFDSKNIKYDAQGRYNPDWLPAEDLKALEEREKLFSDYFSSYTILDVYHVDGELTMGENYADMGGMECITSLAKNREELRTLFESFAYSWSELASDTDAIEYLSEDVHSPNKVRVNAVLSSSDAFYEAYDVQPGDAMYVKPEDRVRRW